MASPADAIIAVTYRCNAHCAMCNIWKGRGQDALRPEHMNKLPRGLKTINISGGEPFLRADLPEFVRCARDRCPGAQITISTNGYLPDRIVQTMDRIVAIDPSVRLAVSLDGIGEVHDRIRGDKGAFASVRELLDKLRATGYRGVRLSMTLFDENLDQLEPVAELAAECGLELGIVAAHGALTHLGVGEPPTKLKPAWLRQPFEMVIKRWLKRWHPRWWLRAHFAYGTYCLLAGCPRRSRCRAGRDFFFLQADGMVYSCSVRGEPMGNIVHRDWREIWQSPKASAARKSAESCGEHCWMICNARSVYRRSALSVIAWILTNKTLAHLGLFRLPDMQQAGEAVVCEDP